MTKGKNAYNFMKENRQTLDSIDDASALGILKDEIKCGLEGKGGLPMYRTFLSPFRQKGTSHECIAVDVGGTSLRCARALIDEDGRASISDIRKRTVPGLDETVSEEDFFKALVDFAGIADESIPVAVSWSYNMESLPGLDAKMLGWCKEVSVSGCSGKTVAGCIRDAAHLPGLSVSVINDSSALALSAAEDENINEAVIALIVGTGFNICCPFRIDGKAELINTECGESDAFLKGLFDMKVIASSADPFFAHAEKQCSGVYLEKIIREAVISMHEEGLIKNIKKYEGFDLKSFGELQVKTADDEMIASAVSEAVKRASGIAAITACSLIDCVKEDFDSFKIVTDGSVINHMPGFMEQFESKLRQLIPENMGLVIEKGNESCLKGAAVSSVAQG